GVGRWTMGVGVVVHAGVQNLCLDMVGEVGEDRWKSLRWPSRLPRVCDGNRVFNAAQCSQIDFVRIKHLKQVMEVVGCFHRLYPCYLNQPLPQRMLTNTGRGPE